MKKIITALICLAVLSPASFGFASFHDVKANEQLNKYLMQRLKEAKDREDENSNFVFASWNYNLQQYAQEFRGEISAMEARIDAKFILSEKYKKFILSNEKERNNFQSAINYFATISQFAKMNDAQVLFYALTLYDVNQIDPSRQKEAEKYLADNEIRFKSFNEKASFKDERQKAKLKYVLVRLKRVNRILGEASVGDGGDFINFCALLSQVFK